jgi:dihydroorotase
MSLNGARFYKLPTNPDTITLAKTAASVPVIEHISAGGDRVDVFQARVPLFWQVVKGLRRMTVQK